MNQLFQEKEKVQMLIFPTIQHQMTGVARVYRGLGKKRDCFCLTYEDGSRQEARVSEFCDPDNLFSIVGCVQEAVKQQGGVEV